MSKKEPDFKDIFILHDVIEQSLGDIKWALMFTNQLEFFTMYTALPNNIIKDSIKSLKCAEEMIEQSLKLCSSLCKEYIKYHPKWDKE